MIDMVKQTFPNIYADSFSQNIPIGETHGIPHADPAAGGSTYIGWTLHWSHPNYMSHRHGPSYSHVWVLELYTQFTSWKRGWKNGVENGVEIHNSRLHETTKRIRSIGPTSGILERTKALSTSYIQNSFPVFIFRVSDYLSGILRCIQFCVGWFWITHDFGVVMVTHILCV